MDQEKNDELNMLNDVQAFFDKPANTTKITTVADLLAGKIELDGYITTIKKKKAITDADTKGLRGNKKHMRELVVSEIIDLAGPLVNLGRKNHDDVLIEKYNWVKSDLDHMRDNDLISAATNTIEDADANSVDLASAGVTPAMITLLTTDLATLSLILSSPEAARQAKKAANQVIDETFPLTREVMDITITPLMRTNFAKTDPDFFKEYLTHTVIITTGVHHLDMFGLCINNTDGTFINGAHIQIFESPASTTPLVEVKSGEKGHFRIKELPEGSLLAKIKHPAFQEKSVTGIAHVKGTAVKITFSLIPA